MVPEAIYDGAPDGYMTQAQAQKQLGVSRGTMQNMVKDGRLVAYRDPRDKRVRLFKVRDVEKLARPVREG